MRRVDPLSRAARSQLMARVRSKGNASTEQVVVRALRKFGISGWRRHLRSIPGTPDFYFPSERVAVFVHGCFWHGCPRCGRIPKTNREFWESKIIENRRRDSRMRRALREADIRSITIWEHDLRSVNWIKRLLRALDRS